MKFIEFSHFDPNHDNEYRKIHVDIDDINAVLERQFRGVHAYFMGSVLIMKNGSEIRLRDPADSALRMIEKARQS